MTKEGFIDEAILIVDLQNDFCPGGKLAVVDGDKVIEPINRTTLVGRRTGRSVFHSRDWHPAITSHFKAYGGDWPEHCVMGTPGAEHPEELVIRPGDVEILKGMKGDAYSAFEGFDAGKRPFLDVLRERGVRKLYVGGLATDYCVGRSVEDALKNGFEVVVLSDAIKAVNVQPDDGKEAIEQMQRMNAVFRPSDEVVREWLDGRAA